MGPTWADEALHGTRAWGWTQQQGVRITETGAHRGPGQVELGSGHVSCWFHPSFSEKLLLPSLSDFFLMI